MKRCCLNRHAMRWVANEHGLFMPVALLFFLIVFILVFGVANNLRQDVSYHQLQTNFLKTNYLLEAGKREAIHLIEHSYTEGNKAGLWQYEAGNVHYLITGVDGGHIVSLICKTDTAIKKAEFKFLNSTGKVVEWKEL